ncbi:glycosyltransferase [Weissella confusa]|uniref:glycosyltransferase n=1 Tax=Weissella confusa TaxID=1583 RepID=UPI0018A29A2D|nr:glycosyltransferase [Weissella confusa]MBF7057196.1 glycosyltransferase [Weissella confusa]
MSSILFVVTELRMGGRERVVTQIAEAFRKKGWDSAIFSTWVRPPFFQTDVPVVFEDSDELVSEPRVTGKLSVVTLGSKFTSIKNGMFFVAKKLFNYQFLQKKRLAALLDVIEKRNVETVILTDLTITFAKRIRERFPNIKIVGWVHMEADPFFNNQYKDFKKELLAGVSNIDKLIGLTEKQAQDFSKYTRADTVRIPNPMPDPAYQEVNPNVVKNESNLLVVARIDIHHKGLDMLIDILARVESEWTLTLIGDGELKDVLKLKKMIENTGISHRIRLLGKMDGVQLRDIYSTGMVFLMTSRYEGFPMTIGEALSFGLPVISFDLEGVQEAAGSSYEKVSSYDLNEFAKKIDALLSNPNRRQELSRAAIQRSTTFSIERVVGRWIEVLESIK